MKSYNHLWEHFISDANIHLAIINASKGKRDRKVFKMIYENPSKYYGEIRNYAENYINIKHTPTTIYDGVSRKKRIIIVPNYKEQILHHMIVNILEPIFKKGMYEHSNGSIPGRGAHKAKKQIEKWIRKDTKNVKYCLKMDIAKYFNSIPHQVLISMLSKKIHDEKFLNILIELVHVMDNVSEYTQEQKRLYPDEDIQVIDDGRGIPLGFYTSQWIANWYLQGLDHYIKEELKAKHYSRYMDDMVIFGSNKKELHKMRIAIDRYLDKELGLKMKSNWQIFRFSNIDKDGNDKYRFLDFMGFRFYRNRTTLRRSIMLKATRKANKISKKKKPTIYDTRQMLSYYGWLKHTATYTMYYIWIRNKVNFKQLKKIISIYSKRKEIPQWNGNIAKALPQT